MPKPDELPPNVKIFVVQQLACFERPSDVAKAVKEEFALEVSRQRVHYYDPTTKLGSALAPELKELFKTTRERFLADVDQIPIANKAVQLRALQKQLEKAERSPGANVVVISLIEAAAKIAGTFAADKHTHELTGKDGQPLQAATATIILTGAPAGALAPQAVGSVPQSGD
jgi:hypothetical protein